jgi:CelD/BcsL family acetyltransferase involved in cellulose biosynthesis
MNDWTNIPDSGPEGRRFLRPAWFRAWEGAFGNYRNWRSPIRYIHICDGADSSCIVPLGTQHIGPFRFASLCGGYFPLRGIPYCGEPRRLAAPLAATLKGTASAVGVRLGPVPDTDPLLALLLPALERYGWKLMRKSIGSEFVLDNPASLEVYKASLSSDRQRKVDYYWRKLNEAGPTELRHFNDAGEAWPMVLRDIAKVEAASWVAREGDPHFMGERTQVYWAKLTVDPWFSRALNVWLIYHGGEPVSFALTLDSGRTRYVLANSFDERVAKFSTGAKIYQQLIFDAFSRGIAQINFGLGDSGYKSRWGARPGATLMDTVAFAPSIGGRTALLLARARDTIQQIRAR